MSAPFPLPLVFAAWGFRNGAANYGNAGGLGSLCNVHGIRTVAVQLGSKETAIHRRFQQRNKSGEPWTNAQDVQWLRERGIRVVVWGVANAAFAVSELQRLGCSEDDWLPQIEGPSQRDLVLDGAAHGLHAHSIITNYSGAGDSPGESDALRSAGVRAVFVECYNDAGIIYPYTDLERMIGQGVQYGWSNDELHATMATYHDERPDDYSGTAAEGREFGIYLAEPMSAAQWDAFGALNTGAPPLPPTPEDDMEAVTDTQGRDAVGFAVQAAAQNWTSEKPKGRLTVARRVCDPGNDDPKWNSVRDQIVKLLDDAGVPQ